MEIKCAKCKKEFEYSKSDKYETNVNATEFVVCPHCQHENYIEEKMLLIKCGVCGDFLYEHIELETANSYIYCPKCKEEADKVRARMTDEQSTGFFALTKMLGITDKQVDEIKEKFDTDYKKQILTDIRNYLIEKKTVADVTWDLEREMFLDTLLADLAEYAEKLGVEL